MNQWTYISEQARNHDFAIREGGLEPKSKNFDLKMYQLPPEAMESWGVSCSRWAIFMIFLEKIANLTPLGSGFGRF